MPIETTEKGGRPVRSLARGSVKKALTPEELAVQIQQVARALLEGRLDANRATSYRALVREQIAMLNKQGKLVEVTEEAMEQLSDAELARLEAVG
jgi:hypothetical protein